MKPNLVFMFADQLRLCSTGYGGDKKAKTPVIDAMSENATDLCNAVSGHPVCAFPRFAVYGEIYYKYRYGDQ